LLHAVQYQRRSYVAGVPKVRISIAGLTDVALVLVDRHGLDALTLSGVAAELGVRPSALYTHVEGLEGLRYHVAVHATANLTARVRDAAVGRAGDDAIHALGSAYRAFAHEHPGQYASTLLPARGVDDELAAASASLLDVFARVYRSGGLGAEEAATAAAATRSAIHGFVTLEACAATPCGPAEDERFAHLLGVVIRGLR